MFFWSINTLQQGINSSTQLRRGFYIPCKASRPLKKIPPPLEIVDYKLLRNNGLYGKTINQINGCLDFQGFFSSEGFPSLEVGQDRCLLFGDLDFQRNLDLVHRNMQNFVDFVLMPKNPCIGKLALYLF